MVYHTLHKSVIVNTSLDKAWDFINNPRNLNAITPSNMEFRIISELPEKMFNGLMIAYKVKIPVLGLTNWVSEIKHINEPYSFVDEQRLGPYKLWYHYHEIKKAPNGVEIIDKVYYRLPYGIFGRIAHIFFIKKTLQTIFIHRNKMFKELLEK